MTTLAKLIIALLLLLFASCNLGINMEKGKRGNGNIVNESRNVSGVFTAIEASEGLDIYITQREEITITVKADENIIDLIQTAVNDQTLKIHTSQPIGKAHKKVYVTLPHITKLTTSSSASLESTATVITDQLSLKSSSGSDIRLSIKANQAECNASSGADITLSGTAETLIATASSGSDIKAGALRVKNANAEASSGADITVNATEQVNAKASSGGDIKYKGNPNNVRKKAAFSEKVIKD